MLCEILYAYITNRIYYKPQDLKQTIIIRKGDNFSGIHEYHVLLINITNVVFIEANSDIMIDLKYIANILYEEIKERKLEREVNALYEGILKDLAENEIAFSRLPLYLTKLVFLYEFDINTEKQLAIPRKLEFSAKTEDNICDIDFKDFEIINIRERDYYLIRRSEHAYQEMHIQSNYIHPLLEKCPISELAKCDYTYDIYRERELAFFDRLYNIREYKIEVIRCIACQLIYTFITVGYAFDITGNRLLYDLKRRHCIITDILEKDKITNEKHESTILDLFIGVMLEMINKKTTEHPIRLKNSLIQRMKSKLRRIFSFLKENNTMRGYINCLKCLLKAPYLSAHQIKEISLEDTDQMEGEQCEDYPFFKGFVSIGDIKTLFFNNSLGNVIGLYIDLPPDIDEDTMQLRLAPENAYCFFKIPFSIILTTKYYIIQVKYNYPELLHREAILPIELGYIRKENFSSEKCKCIKSKLSICIYSYTTFIDPAYNTEMLLFFGGLAIDQMGKTDKGKSQTHIVNQPITVNYIQYYFLPVDVTDLNEEPFFVIIDKVDFHPRYGANIAIFSSQKSKYFIVVGGLFDGVYTPNIEWGKCEIVSSRKDSKLLKYLEFRLLNKNVLTIKCSILFFYGNMCQINDGSYLIFGGNTLHNPEKQIEASQCYRMVVMEINDNEIAIDFESRSEVVLGSRLLLGPAIYENKVLYKCSITNYALVVDIDTHKTYFCNLSL